MTQLPLERIEILTDENHVGNSEEFRGTCLIIKTNGYGHSESLKQQIEKALEQQSELENQMPSLNETTFAIKYSHYKELQQNQRTKQDKQNEYYANEYKKQLDFVLECLGFGFEATPDGACNFSRECDRLKQTKEKLVKINKILESDFDNDGKLLHIEIILGEK